jgi:hypothetical protein
VIPLLADSDGVLAAEIEELRPSRVADETTAGRIVGIDHDTWSVYGEMYRLLIGAEACPDEQGYVAQLQDLAGMLVDLHRRTEQVSEACVTGAGVVR